MKVKVYAKYLASCNECPHLRYRDQLLSSAEAYCAWLPLEQLLSSTPAPAECFRDLPNTHATYEGVPGGAPPMRRIPDWCPLPDRVIPDDVRDGGPPS